MQDRCDVIERIVRMVRLACSSLDRIGQPDDIAAVVCFLVSREWAYMTGQALHVNGELFMP